VTTAAAPKTAVVIGAGPYGLSVAAHLRANGVAVRIFGDVMSSWRSQMPAGMCLKSTPDASSLSAPTVGFRLADFCASRGAQPLGENQVVPIELFISYGQWFAERLVPGVESRQVRAVRQLGDPGRGFGLTLDTGEQIEARAVVLATGLTSMAYLPPELSSVVPAGPGPAAAVSHSSQHRDLSRYAGRRVAVIGAGQSALESAALLHEAGAAVQVLARGHARFGSAPARPATGLRGALPRPRSPLGPTWRIYPFSHGPALFRYLPEQTRLGLVKSVLGPLGAWWLRDRVDGVVPVRVESRVVSAGLADGQVRLTVAEAGGRHVMLAVDHVLAATGYRVDLDRLAFLGPQLQQQLRRPAGWPRLSASFESAVPGLFFTGLAAAGTFGPVMRFVCGSPFTARRVSARVAAQLS